MDSLTHAGAIAFRLDGDGPRFVVVQSNKNRAHWVLAKGHIDPGETPEVTAVRELREEAGVDGEVVATVGDSTFTAAREPVRVRFYLVRRRRDVPPAENRGVAWLSYDDARARLTFEDQRRLLDTARDLVAKAR
jgi:8-oxo-dGTP pyrophosphatase MutT (NUDIX family)